MAIVNKALGGLTPEQKYTLDYFKYNPLTGIIESSRPIETTLNSYYLGQQHKMSSGGENVFFTNMSSNINWFPVWVGLKDQSIPANQDANGLVKPSARFHSEFLLEIEVYGTLDNTGSVSYARAGLVFSDQSVFGQEVVVAQKVNPTDYLFYEVYQGTDAESGTLVYKQELTGKDLDEGDPLIWWFDHPLEGRAGTAIFSRMVIADHQDGERQPFHVRPSSTTPDAHYLKVHFRTFEDKDIATKDDISAIVSGSVYKGEYDADSNSPSLPTGSEANGDFYKVSVGGNGFEVGDLLIYNETQGSYDHIPVRAVTQEGIESSSLKVYDWYVKPDYLGTVRNGKAYTPFIDLQSAIDAAEDGDSIFIDGNVTIQNKSDNAFELPVGKSLYFYGSKGTTIGYASYNKNNGNVFNFEGVLATKDLGFYGLIIKNAGGYGIHTKVTNRVDIEDCVFQYNGWDGTQLNTILDSGTSGLLGFDSTNTDLQNFYAGDHASNGGALRLEGSTYVNVIGNTVTKNLRGIRLQDCGVNGSGFVTRNISSQNIESGIYLAAGTTHYGCQNIVVTINSSSYNANNGLLCVGGLNNKFSQNEVNGNWNAGFCAWGAGNTTLRDCGLYDNNRSTYNGIGNVGDAKGSIQIDDAYDLLGDTVSFNPAGRFIVEILDTQVHNTGLGSNTERVGVFLGSALNDLIESEKNLIKIDDVGFLGQDYCIDLSEVDLTNLKVSLGDNSYQNIGISAIKDPLAGDYWELPFSNHITDINLCDLSVDNTGSVIFKEGVNGSRLNPYKVNDLQAVAYGTNIKFLIKGSNKIQWSVPVSGITIDGVAVNSVQSVALVQLNNLLTNTAGFSGNSNPVTSFALVGNDLTLTLQDSTTYTVDVTSLGVDENKFVNSGAIVDSDLVLTMNDGSEISIDIANMINGTDEASAPDISNQSFDVTKDQAFNVQIALDSGSDIVNQYVELDAPNWAVLDQVTGSLNGTAPSSTGSHVINCKAANAVGGSVNFQVTLNVVEPVYTNTKSLKFRDGVSSYLGGNAALVTSLERSGNGSGSSDAWTVAFWYKGSTANTGQTLFYFGGHDVVNTGHIEVKQTNHNGLKRLRLRYGSNGNHLQLTTPSGSIDPTKWQHIVVSYNGGTTGSGSSNMSDYYSRFKVFIDGVEQSTSNTHSNYGWANSIVGQNFRFGRFSSGNYPKDILLNQLVIWNSDQSSNVVGLYNGGDTQDISLLAAGVGSMNTNYLPPVHYYEIEDSVSTVEDLIGTAHFVGYNFVSSDLVDDTP